MSSGLILRCLGSVVLGSFSVVAGGSVGCSVILGGLGVVNRSLCLIVAWSRIILGFLGVVNWGSVHGCVISGLFGAVLGSLGIVTCWSVGCGVVARCTVGCGVVNWSLGVVFRFNVVRRSSRCVVSRGCVILDRLSCVARGRVILRGFGVVARGSISCGVILWSLGGVVLKRLGVVSLFGGVISWSLGVVSGS